MLLNSDQLQEKAKQIRVLIVDIDGVMTDGSLYYHQTGEYLKAFYVRDGFGIKLLQKAGLQVAIISGRNSPLVYSRAQDLGIDSSAVFLAVADKASALDTLCQSLNVKPEQMAFMGDDWIDLPVLARVGLATCVIDAHDEVKSRVHWISAYPGGRGAVRELCELILRSQQSYDTLLNRYIS